MSDPSTAQSDVTAEPTETVANLYRFVSAVLADPPRPEAVREFKAGLRPGATELPTEPLQSGFNSIREWADSIEDVEATATALERAHTRLFVGPRPALQIHESYYAGDYLGQPLATLKKRYATLGIQPSEGLKEEADHAAVELAALAVLTRQEGDRLRAKRTFLKSHGWWLPSLAADIRETAESPFYQAVGAVLAGLIRHDTARLEVELDRPGD